MIDNTAQGDSQPTRLPAPAEGVVEQMDRQEISVLAQELANSYKVMVDVHRKNGRVSAEEEHAAYSWVSDAGEISTSTFEDVQWYHLDALQRKDPAAMLRQWQAMKQAATDQLQSGHTAAMSITSAVGEDTPWERAQFLAIRNGLVQEWQPRGGGEMLLIDMMAQAQCRYLYWLELEVMYTGCDTVERKTKQKHDRIYDWEPPRVSRAQAIEQATQMADRYNRMFLRTLRQLRDLRRYSGPLVVSGGQVNIAQGGQQLNLAVTSSEG